MPEETTTTTVAITKKTPIKLSVGNLILIVGVLLSCAAGLSKVVWQLSQIMHNQELGNNEMKTFMATNVNSLRSDMAKYFGESWHIQDEVESVHQQRSDPHGQPPDVSEVLRVTRQKNGQP